MRSVRKNFPTASLLVVLVLHFNLTVELDIEISPRNGIIGGERNSWNSSFRIEWSSWPLFFSLPVAIPPHF